MNNENNKNILIDIDSIMDTRLPMVYLLDNDLSSKIVKDGTYFSRYTNEFKHITRDIFESLYRDRDKSVLELATPTNILKLIRNYCEESYGMDSVLGSTGNMCVYINIFPYKLKSTEYELLKSGLGTLIGGVNIKVISMNIDELTPTWIDKNIRTMVMYDGMKWFERHISNLSLIKNPLLNVQLLAPAIVDMGNSNFINTIDDPEKLFSDVENNAKTLIDLHLLPAKDFSIIY